MRLTLPYCSALLIAAVAAPLAAQSNADRMANDRYTRSHDYDLRHERIEVRGFNWSDRSFDGRVTVRLAALRAGLDSVILDAGALLDITAVRSGAAALAFEHVRDTLVVRLSKPLPLGDSTAFVINYHARVRNGHGLTFLDADTGSPARPRQIWSQGEDDNNHDWFPTYDFPNDKLTWELVATVPGDCMAVSNGRLVTDRRNPDGTRTVSWFEEQAASSYLVSLIVAPLVRVPDRWNGIPVDYYVYRQDSALARPLFRVTPDMIGVYSRLTGVKYPWAKYAQTTVADFFGGMENVSATTLVDWLPDARAYADRPWYQYILIPHELAHQWFGDYVTTVNWANMWLNEGFAEFMPGQYWLVRRGRHAADDYYLDEYQQFLRIDHGRRMPLASLGSNNIYPKGALVLEMLRKRLGDDRFWAGIRRYLHDHAYGTATSDDLRQAFLEATGENLASFWDQWVYQAGYPEFDVTAAWDSASATVSVTVRQEQRDTLPADSTGLRYGVPEIFRVPVTIRVGTGTAEITASADLTQREQTIAVAGVTSAPTMVIFDDGNTILKRLTFEQPSTWLAAQLARDPDLWNRAWAIAQLAGRADDTEALAALLHAATRSDYYLTRVQAIGALAGFSGTGVAAALEEAAHDTSAAVRAAALEALAGVPSPAAVALARRGWEKDTSYAVRAAALGALVRLEPAGAAALIRQALATGSYQNAIQDAALFGIVQTGDTTMLEEVNRAVASVPNATHALAAFAGRGNRVALTMLEAYVDSPRSALRQRALQAFRFSLPPALARERLTALRDAAPDDTIRAEIVETLGQLKP